jgi:apyrase
VKGTLGVVDVDSVDAQLAYALDDKAVAKAQAVSGVGYVSQVGAAAGGFSFNLYSHSHIGFGASSARAKVLRPSHVGPEKAHGQGHPCLAEAVLFQFANGSWEGGGVEEGAQRLEVSQPACSALANRLLRRSPCPPWKQEECSFGGAWGGGGGAGAQRFYASGALFDSALHAGLVPPGSLSAQTTSGAYRQAASAACGLTGPALRRAFKRGPPADSSDLSFFCWDLTYAHALLSHGLGIAETAPLTAVRRMQYRSRLVEAGWPLGDAITALDS